MSLLKSPKARNPAKRALAVRSPGPAPSRPSTAALAPTVPGDRAPAPVGASASAQPSAAASGAPLLPVLAADQASGGCSCAAGAASRREGEPTLGFRVPAVPDWQTLRSLSRGPRGRRRVGSPAAGGVRGRGSLSPGFPDGRV